MEATKEAKPANLNMPIDRDLLTEVSYVAKKAGKTQREWVVGVLRRAVGWKNEDEEGDTVGEDPEPFREPGSGPVVEARYEFEEGGVPAASTPNAEAAPRLSEAAREQLAKVAASPFGREHDPKTCRVYRCTLCAMAGVKNKARGLE